MISKEKWEKDLEKIKAEIKGKEYKIKRRALRELEVTFVNSMLRSLPNEKFGILFSGGIDSTLMAFLAKRLSDNFICYSVGFHDENQKYPDDLEWSEKIAKKFNFPYKKIVINFSKAEKILKKTVNIVGNDVVKVGVGAVLVAAEEQLKKDNIKYVYSGLGSEEIFAGYQRHKDRKLDNEKHINNNIKGNNNNNNNNQTINDNNKEAIKNKNLEIDKKQENIQDNKKKINNKIRNININNKQNINNNNKEIINDNNLKINNNNNNQDIINEECWNGLFAMYNRDFKRDFPIAEALNFEIKLPFLDYELIELAMKIPGKWKIKQDLTKYILREMALNLGLPKNFAFRKKKAAQYGSRIDRAIKKLASRNDFDYKKEYLKSLIE